MYSVCARADESTRGAFPVYHAVIVLLVEFHFAIQVRVAAYQLEKK
jgi:hypothetical protein